MNFDRFEWLAQTVESAIDPDRPIVDAHHHLWDRPDSIYLAPQLLADLTGSHNVVRSVFVECGAGYDATRPGGFEPVGETEFVRRQIATTESAGGAGPSIGAIVGHADMMLGDAVADVLAAHVEAGDGYFRGIRHATSWDASDDIRKGHSRPFDGMMLTPEFQAGVRTLASMDLSFDAWLFHTQLDELGALADAVPEATFVLDHLGGPLGVGPYGSDRDSMRSEWRAALTRVAQRLNVVVKIGGIGMEMYFGMGWHERPAPPGSVGVPTSGKTPTPRVGAREMFRHNAVASRSLGARRGNGKSTAIRCRGDRAERFGRQTGRRDQVRRLFERAPVIADAS